MCDTVKLTTKKGDVKPANGQQAQNHQQSRVNVTSVPTYYALSDSVQNPSLYHIQAPIQLQDPDTEQNPDTPAKAPMSFDDFFNKLLAIIDAHVDNAHIENPNNDKVLGILSENAKEAFRASRNYEILIFKILSTNTTRVDIPKSEHELNGSYIEFLDGNQEIKEKVKNAFESLAVPIEQTLNDIVHWVSHYGGTTITNIKLTDSDIHARGVGVCIVKYDDDKNIVIKPEDKSFEAAVYGNDEGSLANKFNSLLARGLLQGLTKTKIGTLNIKASKDHGSAVQYLDHKRFEDDDMIDITPESDPPNKVHKENVDSDSIRALIAFCSLLGLADLHVENLAYYQEQPDGPYLPQLIDAEVGMHYLLNKAFSYDNNATGNSQSIERLKAVTLSDYGQMVFKNTPQNNSIPKDIILDGSLKNFDPKLMEEFIDSMEQTLKEHSTRFLLISTGTLFEKRNAYLKKKKETDQVEDPEYLQLYNSAKDSLEKKGFTVTELVNDITFKDWLEEDFTKGRIPFFKLNINSGEIYQESSGGPTKKSIFTINVNKKSFLDGMIEDRKKALLPGSFIKWFVGLLGMGILVGWGIYMLIKSQ